MIAYRIVGYKVIEGKTIVVCKTTCLDNLIEFEDLPKEIVVAIILNINNLNYIFNEKDTCIYVEEHFDRYGVLPGLIYQNIKTKDNYIVLSVGTNTTNKDDGTPMVGYMNLETGDIFHGRLYYRKRQAQCGYSLLGRFQDQRGAVSPPF